MKDRDMPYGNYSEAIPMDKLLRMTHARLAAHSNYTDEQIREYAVHVVELELCVCASSSRNIVDALVVEVLRDARR